MRRLAALLLVAGCGGVPGVLFESRAEPAGRAGHPGGADAQPADEDASSRVLDAARGTPEAGQDQGSRPDVGVDAPPDAWSAPPPDAGGVAPLDAGVDAPADSWTRPDAGVDAGPCAPLTYRRACANATCAVVTDGCGGTWDCYQPPSCASQGAECGGLVSACMMPEGLEVFCGTCSTGYTCLLGRCVR